MSVILTLFTVTAFLCGDTGGVSVALKGNAHSMLCIPCRQWHDILSVGVGVGSAGGA